jgi:hypothetical protein
MEQSSFYEWISSYFMKKLNIIRIGSAHGSPGRYIDVATSPDIASVLWIAKRGDIMVENIFRYGESQSAEFRKKFKVIYFSESFRFKVIKKLTRLSNINNFIAKLSYYPLLLISRFMYLPEISSSLKDKDINFIWAGNNDSDSITQILLCYAHQFTAPLVFAYQEHRCSYRMDEAYSIKVCDILVLSSQRNLEFFSTLYDNSIINKSIIANEDWRSIQLIKKVNDYKVNKLSSFDNIPRILILARFVTYGVKKNKRRGNRVNYLNIIEAILASGAIVHLNCLAIYECLDTKTYCKNNPYEQLKTLYPDTFFIDEAYDMEDIASYLDMKKFDAGILHNYVAGEKVSQFSKMNTPNRFFEYLVADIIPIVIKNTLLDVEEIINKINYGIVAESYPDAIAILKKILVSGIKPETKTLHSINFSIYINTLVSAYERMRLKEN